MPDYPVQGYELTVWVNDLTKVPATTGMVAEMELISWSYPGAGPAPFKLQLQFYAEGVPLSPPGLEGAGYPFAVAAMPASHLSTMLQLLSAPGLVVRLSEDALAPEPAPVNVQFYVPPHDI
ncbi:hypothetical protein ACIBI9_38835 [Nonomuraea sp. NPDC050451]|uniref:hypothetical protein n=1 Tax=Nonomuraea sp. NPDC050451 TaxID=3364364 RepID=UPI0037BAB4D0